MYSGRITRRCNYGDDYDFFSVDITTPRDDEPFGVLFREHEITGPLYLISAISNLCHLHQW